MLILDVSICIKGVVCDRLGFEVAGYILGDVRVFICLV